MAFEGYLIANASTNAKLPNKFIDVASFDSAPNIREEITAFRDDNTRNLTRITAQGKKTTIKWTVPKGLSLADKVQLQNFLVGCMTDQLQRKVYIKYWNDEDNIYKTGYFYISNISFPIIKITNNNIIYGQFDIQLIEY